MLRVVLSISILFHQQRTRFITITVEVMADDREILREMWDGKLPISFTLSSDEVENDRPESMYVSIKTSSKSPCIIYRFKPFSSCSQQLSSALSSTYK